MSVNAVAEGHDMPVDKQKMSLVVMPAPIVVIVVPVIQASGKSQFDAQKIVSISSAVAPVIAEGPPVVVVARDAALADHDRVGSPVDDIPQSGVAARMPRAVVAGGRRSADAQITGAPVALDA